MDITSAIRATTRVPLLQAIKMFLAPTAAWLVCLALISGQPPIFAAIAALLVVQPSVNQSLGKAVERSAGVLIGVVLAFVLGLVLGDRQWAVLVAIVASVMLGWALRLTPGSAVQIPISAMLVLTLGGDTEGYALYRIIETLIGAAMGLLVNAVIVPPVVLQPARSTVMRLGGDTAAIFDALADAISEPRSRGELAALLNRARALHRTRIDAEEAVERGRDSLAFNLRRSQHRRVLEADAAMLARLTVLVTRVVGMTRAVHDHYEPGLTEEPTVRAIATELRRAGHDLRLLIDDSPRSDEAITADMPALTSPIAVAKPHEEHWILLGSLLEDLRRVRETIIGADGS